MRLTKAGWLVGAAIVIGGVLLCAIIFHGDTRERKLSDGTSLRLERVFYGKPDQVARVGLMTKIGSAVKDLWQQIFKTPTNPYGSGSSSWYMNTTIHTNNDALLVYMRRLNLPEGGYRNGTMYSAEIVDEHGCCFRATQEGGEDDGAGNIVDWYRFEAFPRHEKKLRLRIYGMSEQQLAEFNVSNPSPPPKITNWVLSTFPITNKDDEVTFTLASLKATHDPDASKSSGRWGLSSFKFEPAYETSEGGHSTSNWQALETELYDSSGNFASVVSDNYGWLCPHEAAWKLRVRFFGSEQSPFASNVTWTLRGLEIPGAGNFTNLNTSQTLDGVNIKALTFAGTGDFHYSIDGAITGASASKETLKSSWLQGGGSRTNYCQLHGKTPHLAIRHGQLSDDQRLTVHATDEQGRDYYGRDCMFGSGDYAERKTPPGVHYLMQNFSPTINYITFDLPPDVKKVDLTFCIHTCRVEEFVFKPPPVEDTSTPAKPAK